MKVLVTGDSFSDFKVVAQELDKRLAIGDTIVTDNTYSGVLFAAYAKENNLKCKIFTPNWKADLGSAYQVNHWAMVRASDKVIIFSDGEFTTKTANVVIEAKKCGINVDIIKIPG